MRRKLLVISICIILLISSYYLIDFNWEKKEENQKTILIGSEYLGMLAFIYYNLTDENTFNNIVEILQNISFDSTYAGGNPDYKKKELLFEFYNHDNLNENSNNLIVIVKGKLYIYNASIIIRLFIDGTSNLVHDQKIIFQNIDFIKNELILILNEPKKIELIEAKSPNHVLLPTLNNFCLYIK